MKHLRKSLLSLVLNSLSLAASKDDAPSVTAVNSKVYDLGTVGTGVSGKATFIENSDATVSIELELLILLKEDLLHIHLNNAADGGDIALTLKPVDGTTEKQQHLKLLIMVVLSRIKRYLILTDI
jgi:hypothetical protein